MKNNWPILVSAILVSASILISPHLAPPSTPIPLNQFRDQVRSQIAGLSGVDVDVHMAPYRSTDDIYVAELSHSDAQGSHSTRVRFSHNGVGQYAGKIMGSFLGKAEDVSLLIDSVTK